MSWAESGPLAWRLRCLPSTLLYLGLMPGLDPDSSFVLCRPWDGSSHSVSASPVRAGWRLQLQALVLAQPWLL